MPTPGSADKLNIFAGAAAFINFTAAEETALATKVFPANIIVKKTDGKFYQTDGVATVANLAVMVDQILVAHEKTALANAFDANGDYQIAAGGVVVHDANGKIADASLNVVTGDKITRSYLRDYIDPETNIIKVEALPATARAGIKYVANYAALAGLTEEEKKSAICVLDASDDPSGMTTSGAAMYVFVDNPEYTEGGEEPEKIWLKLAEVESLDIDVSAIECSYANIVKAGGVTTDMTALWTISATNFAAMLDAAQESE